MANHFNILEQFMDAQKNVFDAWQNLLLPGDNKKKEENEGFTYDPTKFFKEMAGFNQKLYGNHIGDVNQVFQKISQGSDFYCRLYKLWEDLNSQYTPNFNSAKKAYDDWTQQYYKYIKDNYISYLPEYMQKFIHQYIKMSESYQAVMNNFWQPWFEDHDKLNILFLKGAIADPKSYLEYIRLWKENYDKTFSKVIGSPALGINREFIEKQFESIDKFIQYNTIVSEFYAKIFSVGQETMQKLLNDYMNMFNEGIQPKTFDEFYKLWTEEIEKAFDNLFISDDFAKLMGHLVEASMTLKMELDKLMEEYISFMPIPKKSDLDSLYKTVYDLKKQVKDLKKEAKDLKKELDMLKKIKPTDADPAK